MNILQEINTILDEVNYSPKVAIKISGKLYHFTEPQIRALQVLVARKYGKSEELFEEFNNAVQVYSDYHIKDSYRIYICRDGYLDNFFKQNGFYDANINMSRSLTK